MLDTLRCLLQAGCVVAICDDFTDIFFLVVLFALIELADD